MVPLPLHPPSLHNPTNPPSPTVQGLRPHPPAPAQRAPRRPARGLLQDPAAGRGRARGAAAPAAEPGGRGRRGARPARRLRHPARHPGPPRARLAGSGAGGADASGAAAGRRRGGGGGGAGKREGEWDGRRDGRDGGTGGGVEEFAVMGGQRRDGGSRGRYVVGRASSMLRLRAWGCGAVRRVPPPLSYPNHVHPRPIEHPVAHHPIRRRALRVRQPPRLHRELGVGAGRLALRQRAGVGDEHALDDLPVSASHFAKRMPHRLTLTNGGSELGITSTSGRTPGHSASLR